jgi:hypothetical protein
MDRRLADAEAERQALEDATRRPPGERPA